MTPYEAVRAEFEFPFEFYPFQIEETDELAQYERVAKYWEPGTGKTAASVHWALYQSIMMGIEHWVCPMPPVLMYQWARFVRSITHKASGQKLTASVYSGSQAQRFTEYTGDNPKRLKKIDLDVDFVFTSYGILKNDHDRLMQFYQGKKVGVISDEGHAIKNIESLTHKAVRDFAADRPLNILTGTPITKPHDCYAYIKLVAPGVYRNRKAFHDLHVSKIDQYQEPTDWQNLELLASNMKIQTSRVLRRTVRPQMPPVTYTPIVYELDPKHLELYERIAVEKLVELEGGGEINAISASALRSTLQQVVMNWAHFAEEPERQPAGLDLVTEVLEELGDNGKLIIVANFVRTNTYLLEKLQPYNAVAVFGSVSAAGKQQAIRDFIEDPKCRVILLQPQSGGFGVDGLQQVCSDMLVLEAPTTAPPFHQVVARIDRDGQTRPINCRIAIANKTVQVRMFRDLLDNDALINSVQGGYEDLREAIHGN